MRLARPFSRRCCCRAVGAVAAAAAVAAGTAAAHPAGDACTSVGLSNAAAERAYGTGARVAPLPLIGDGPSYLTNVPACFVYARGGTVVATVQLYPKKDWSDLLAIYRAAQARKVPLNGLGTGAVLFDVAARPQNYEEVILFFGGRSLVAARAPLVVSAHAPLAPPRELTVLVHGIHARLPVVK